MPSQSNGRPVAFIDRSPMVTKLNEYLTIDPASTALVGVDLIRGHLDPEIATLPLPADEARRVIDANKKLFDLVRAQGLPVIHAVQRQRRHPEPSADVLSNPFWSAVLAVGETLSPGMSVNLREHNLEGSRHTEIMPELGPVEGDHIVVKKRLTAFYATDLELLLKSLKIDTILLTGVNTNTCITGTAFEAMHRDFKVIVAADPAGSSHGADLAAFALQNFARCVGWVLTTDEIAEKLRAGRAVAQGGSVAATAR